MQLFFSKYGKRILFPCILLCGIPLYFLLQDDPSSEVLIEQAIPNTINEPVLSENNNEKMAAVEQQPAIYFVDVKGAVKFPGVYELSSEQRIVDAIELAGGYLENANPQLINHAQKVQDEMVVYVPKVGEEIPETIGAAIAVASNGQSASSNPQNDKVNINTADEAQLTTLPGIGPAKAKAIISYREQNGPFSTPEDLKKVSGIGEKSYVKLSEFIDVK